MSAPMAKRVDDVVFAVVSVTDYLLKGNKITDDTVIHSLFESIKLNFDSIDSIEKAGLHTFVEDVAKNCTELDSFTVVHGLEVTGWLGGNDVYYRHFKASVHLSFHTLWEKLQSKDLCDVSVTTALYESLISLTKHKEGLQWIVTDQTMSDVTIEGLTLLTGCSSIFLEKAVLRYLSSVMLELERIEGLTPSACSMLFSSRILDTATKNIKSHYNKKHVGPFVPGSLQLLENLCRQSQGTSKHLLTNQVEFFKYLLDMIGSLNARDCDTVLNIIGALLKVHVGTEEDSCTVIGDQMNDFIRQIKDQLTQLATEGNVVTAQKLAACCLKSQGTVRLEQSCKAILVQPVQWILQDDVERCVFPEHVLESALSTRCRCTDVVCRSLNGNAIGANMVTDLLRRTIVFSGHEDKSCTRVASYLYKNRKIQRKCLETLLSGTHCRKDEECDLLTRAQTVVELFREPDSESVIYSLCSQLLLAWLPSMFRDENTVSITVDLGRTIQRHLSALQWELRDTTLELLGRIIEKYKDNTYVIKWMVEHRLHVQIWQCVKDGESYVRASAISALYQLCQCPQLVSALAESDVVSNEGDIIEAVMGIVENDTEAFARRSAVTFLLNLFKVKVTSRVRDTSDGQDSSGVVPDNVIGTIVKATRDFDWEVKLVALDFIGFIIQQELSQCSKSGRTPSEVSEYAKDLFSRRTADRSEVEATTSCVIERLCRTQVVSVLIDALDDYDDKVNEKAFKVFTDLQSGLRAVTNHCKTGTEIEELHNHSELSYSDENVLDVENKDSDLTNRCGIKKRKLDDMYLSGTTDSKKDLDTSEQVSLEHRTNNLEKNLRNLGHLTELSCITNDRNGVKDENIAKKQEHMLNKILDFDVSVYRSRLEQVNDEAAKLVSLVEDIVTAGDKEEDENAVDCY